VVKPIGIEAQTNIDSPIVVKPIEAPSKIDLFYRAKNLNQICYLSSNIHQGDKYLVFNLVETAENTPLIDWSTTTLMSLYFNTRGQNVLKSSR
jgi:uncharacterized protein (UPF0128 family)